MWVVASIGFLTVVVGGLFLFSPQTVVRLNAWCNQHVFSTDQQAINYRVGMGLFLLAGGIFCIVSSVYLIRLGR